MNMPKPAFLVNNGYVSVMYIILMLFCYPSLSNDLKVERILVMESKTDGIKIIDCHYIIDGSTSLAPNFQEIVIGDDVHRIDVANSVLIAAAECDGWYYFLNSGNFGYYVSRMCRDGNFEFVCDFLEVGFHTIKKFRVIEVDGGIEISIECICFGGDCSDATTKKVVFDGLSYPGCKRLYRDYCGGPEG
jgi:hypothetical protein